MATLISNLCNAQNVVYVKDLKHSRGYGFSVPSQATEKLTRDLSELGFQMQV